MADLTNGSGVYATYNNAGTGVAELGDNKLPANGESNGLGGRTRILKLAKSSITAAEVQSVMDALQAGGTKGVNDAVVIAGFADTNANYVHVAVQGTGILTAAADYLGVTGVTMTVEADFPGLKA